MKEKIPLEIYIHIPFCARKCLYCDFLSFEAEAVVREQYVEKLTQEIEAMGTQYEDYEVVSIFLGGGTPSLLEGEQTVRVMEAVSQFFCVHKDTEVTTEANPGTVDEAKLRVYREVGINRLSLGLQSAEDKELKELGRIHTYEEFLESFQAGRAVGFENINIDLMSAIPGQSLDSYKRTLEAVIKLEPEHISAYSLIVEEGTPFYARYGDMGHPTSKTQFPPLPDEDTERHMYHFTKDYLSKMGYERYEISNYAKPGKACRHNEGYWTGREYLGLGLGASSYTGGERYQGEVDLETYLGFDRQAFADRKHHKEREQLTKQDQMEEFMFLGLRLAGGISSLEFEKRFGLPAAAVYGAVLERCLDGGLLEKIEIVCDTNHTESRDIYWRLTDYGTDVSNQVLSMFLL